MTSSDYLRDPSRARFRAANALAAVGEKLTLDTMPEGEVIWQEDGDSVTLTPDGWLVWVNPGKAVLWARRVRATAEQVAELRGKETKRPTARPPRA